MVTTQDLLQRLREFENSPQGYAHELRMELAELILRGLDERGWTQKRLAKESGVSKRRIQKVIYAEDNCTFETAGKLLFALGVKPKLTRI